MQNTMEIENGKIGERILRSFRRFFQPITWFFQRRFRKHGCSDSDLWDLDGHLAKIILPKLRAYRNYSLHGYPTDFLTWEDVQDSGEYKNAEEYEHAVQKGELTGGGFEKWLSVLDEMIFAFEFFLADSGNCKELKNFILKYGDWHEEKPENKKYPQFLNINEPITGNSKSDLSKTPYYFDDKLYSEHGKRAQKGFELFGKYFCNLWD